MRHERMARLVVGEDRRLLVGQDLLLLEPGDHALECVVEIQSRNVLRLPAPGEDRRFVRDVREIGAGRPEV